MLFDKNPDLVLWKISIFKLKAYEKTNHILWQSVCVVASECLKLQGLAVSLLKARLISAYQGAC
jgi:hypothetical protein